jgi:hypothetical protein
MSLPASIPEIDLRHEQRLHLPAVLRFAARERVKRLPFLGWNNEGAPVPAQVLQHRHHREQSGAHPFRDSP